ncbi:hypothetical protein NDU88_001498 [Pleurodeles waltl]|uniref:Uncharacterized protein n=1 Tax=Pleurodeles waltl TaxID=8319 RepID=A0AAV7WMC2_PLEWA|nr:hypothetical protein NDU88_001496 [Pleurodeles waltl]KAJ1213868.1 hypothetical protein NDU88_001498 [Pleurodeles waltl]
MLLPITGGSIRWPVLGQSMDPGQELDLAATPAHAAVFSAQPRHGAGHRGTRREGVEASNKPCEWRVGGPEGPGGSQCSMLTQCRYRCRVSEASFRHTFTRNASHFRRAGVSTQSEEEGEIDEATGVSKSRDERTGSAPVAVPSTRDLPSGDIGHEGSLT